MRLERVELFLIRLPLKAPYETSGSRETHQTRVIARIESEGIVAWGESVAPETPWYSGETPETVWWLLDEIAIPRVLAADLSGPEDTSRVLGWIKEHRMAKATLEMAIWDLFAKAQKKPLSKLLGGTRDRILCGVAIGIQPSIDALLDKISNELEGGYQRVKVKIKPGWDEHVAEAIRSASPIYRSSSTRTPHTRSPTHRSSRGSTISSASSSSSRWRRTTSSTTPRCKSRSRRWSVWMNRSTRPRTRARPSRSVRRA